MVAVAVRRWLRYTKVVACSSIRRGSLCYHRPPGTGFRCVNLHDNEYRVVYLHVLVIQALFDVTGIYTVYNGGALLFADNYFLVLFYLTRFMIGICFAFHSRRLYPRVHVLRETETAAVLIEVRSLRF